MTLTFGLAVALAFGLAVTLAFGLAVDLDLAVDFGFVGIFVHPFRSAVAGIMPA